VHFSLDLRDLNAALIVEDDPDDPNEPCGERNQDKYWSHVSHFCPLQFRASRNRPARSAPFCFSIREYGNALADVNNNLETDAGNLIRGGLIAYADQRHGETLLPAAMQTPRRCGHNQKQANFDKDLFGVQRIDARMIHTRIRQYPVGEQAGACGVREIVKALPVAASDFEAIDRSRDDDDEKLECCGADGVFELPLG
jgi:hypothetical protein